MKPSVSARICSGEAGELPRRNLAPQEMGKNRKSIGRRCPSLAMRRASCYGAKKRRPPRRPLLGQRRPQLPPLRLQPRRRWLRSRRHRSRYRGRRQLRASLQLLRAGLFRSLVRSRALLLLLRHRFRRLRPSLRQGRLSRGRRHKVRALTLRLSRGLRLFRRLRLQHSSSPQFMKSHRARLSLPRLPRSKLSRLVRPRQGWSQPAGMPVQLSDSLRLM
jgi:hypothetical protein